MTREETRTRKAEADKYDYIREWLISLNNPEGRELLRRAKEELVAVTPPAVVARLRAEGKLPGLE